MQADSILKEPPPHGCPTTGGAVEGGGGVYFGFFYGDCAGSRMFQLVMDFREKYLDQRNRIFVRNSNVLIPIFFQPDGVNL